MRCAELNACSIFTLSIARMLKSMLSSALLKPGVSKISKGGLATLSSTGKTNNKAQIKTMTLPSSNKAQCDFFFRLHGCTLLL